MVLKAEAVPPGPSWGPRQHHSLVPRFRGLASCSARAPTPTPSVREPWLKHCKITRIEPEKYIPISQCFFFLKECDEWCGLLVLKLALLETHHPCIITPRFLYSSSVLFLAQATIPAPSTHFAIQSHPSHSQRQLLSCSAEPRKYGGPASEYLLETNADALVARFGAWIAERGGGPFGSLKKDPEPVDQQMVFDRWMAHTSFSKDAQAEVGGCFLRKREVKRETFPLTFVEAWKHLVRIMIKHLNTLATWATCIASHFPGTKRKPPVTQGPNFGEFPIPQISSFWLLPELQQASSINN